MKISYKLNLCCIVKHCLPLFVDLKVESQAHLSSRLCLTYVLPHCKEAAGLNYSSEIIYQGDFIFINTSSESFVGMNIILKLILMEIC